MKEIIIYLIAAISSLFILGYTVHMFVGGLVSEHTENMLIIASCAIATVIIAFMVRDVIKRRQSQ